MMMFSYIELLSAAKHLHIMVVVIRAAKAGDRLHLEYFIGLAPDLKRLPRVGGHVADAEEDREREEPMGSTWIYSVREWLPMSKTTIQTESRGGSLCHWRSDF
jgi:hypothetical protein